MFHNNGKPCTNGVLNSMRTIFLRSNLDIKFAEVTLSKLSSLVINEKLKRIEPKFKAKVISNRSKSKSWESHWVDMPRFHQKKQEPLVCLRIETNASSEYLSRMFKQTITDKTKSIWFPKLNRGLGSFAWVSESELQPRYPFYIISKGRPNCITARALEKCGINYKIVIEESDLCQYLEYHDRSVLHVGDFINDSKSSIPVRNYVDKISPSDWYWLLDDNIEDFNYLTDNNKYVVRTGVIFVAAEDFVNRYTNIGQAGFNYYSFSKKTDPVPAFCLNTRIYSCTLMNRNVEIEREKGKLWRGRYNEDTDLSLRILKAGYCTVLFNTFLAGKVTTQRLKGGNTDNVYIDGDERLQFAESLRLQHPDVTKVVRRFNRWHHHVDYRGFKQKLEYKKNYLKRDYKLKLKEGARYSKNEQQRFNTTTNNITDTRLSHRLCYSHEYVVHPPIMEYEDLDF
jgi:hypothetical protein